MFDMQYTGAKLAEARRASDMTQMELAERLGISFQAVSSWERGNTMPDIAKLPELADILGVTVDELLGGNSKVADGVIAGDLPERVRSGEVSVSEVAEAVPVMKPSELDDFADKLSELNGLAEQTGENQLKRPSGISELEEIFPFLGEEVRQKLFARAFESGDLGGLCELAPFVGREIVSRYAVELYRREGLGRIEDLLPFIDKDVLSQIADEVYEKRGLSELEELAPFMDRDKLCKLAAEAIERDGIKAISPIAPFLGREFLEKYVRERYL